MRLGKSSLLGQTEKPQLLPDAGGSPHMQESEMVKEKKNVSINPEASIQRMSLLHPASTVWHLYAEASPDTSES